MSSATSLWRLCVVVVIVVTMLAVPAVSHGGEAFPVDVAGDVANDSINDVAGDVTNDVANDVAEHHFLDIRMPGIYPDRVNITTPLLRRPPNASKYLSCSFIIKFNESVK